MAGSCHLTGVDLYRAGPGFPTPANTVPIRNRITGEYITPSYVLVEGRGVRTTRDLAKAIHYIPEDAVMVLVWLGAGWM